MEVFRLAYTGDLLDENGKSAYGDIRLDLLDNVDHIRYRFLLDHAPRPGDQEYWERFYSMEVTADQIVGLDGLVVLRPSVRRDTFSRGAGDLTVIGRSG